MTTDKDLKYVGYSSRRVPQFEYVIMQMLTIGNGYAVIKKCCTIVYIKLASREQVKTLAMGADPDVIYI